jgi:16S rRNA (adenine1518-N6/adenine1519-N6)-dimethyltransferase
MYARGLPTSFVPKKRLGQNFLTDKRWLEKIASYAEISPDDIVLEVGPGLGGLTQLLQTKAKKVITVEKDPVLVEFLSRKFLNNPKVEIITGDILKIDLPDYNKVVATPPYNISSKLLFLLLRRRCQTIILALQKEFAERLVAKPGTKDYGRLTVMIAHKARAEILDHISRDAFNPRPKVDSAIIKVTLADTKKGIDEEPFVDVVRGLFTQRRRTLRVSLKHYLRDKTQSFPKEIYELGILDKRVFQLSVEEFEEIARGLTSILVARKETLSP